MIEVICGPMFSGKSEELIRRLVRHQIAGKRIEAFKSSIDTRSEDIVSRAGSKFPVYRLSTLSLSKADVIGIDEAQFLPEETIDVIKDHAHYRQVIVSGLDMTFVGEPFGIMPHLLAVADRITKLSAICPQCGEDAIYTQRLRGGDELVQIGSSEYEPRCRQHFTP